MSLTPVETVLGFHQLAVGYLAKSGSDSNGMTRPDLVAVEQALVRFGDVMLQPVRVVHTPADVASLLVDLRRVTTSPYSLWSCLLTDQPAVSRELETLLVVATPHMGVHLAGGGTPPQWPSDVTSVTGWHPWHFPDSIALLQSAMTIADFGRALQWVDLVGHEEMFDAPQELKRMIEACLTPKYLNTSSHDVNRWFLSEVGLRALTHLARRDPMEAAPLLRELATGEKRIFEGEILEPNHPLIFHILVRLTRWWSRELAEPILADWLEKAEFKMAEGRVGTMRVIGTRPNWKLEAVGERVVSVREDLGMACHQMGSTRLFHLPMERGEIESNQFIERLILTGDLELLQHLARDNSLRDSFYRGIYNVLDHHGIKLRKRLPHITPFLKFLAGLPIGALQTEAIEALVLMYQETKVLAAAQALSDLGTSPTIGRLVQLASDSTQQNGGASPLEPLLARTGHAEAEAFFRRQLAATSRLKRVRRRDLAAHLAVVQAARTAISPTVS